VDETDVVVGVGFAVPTGVELTAVPLELVLASGLVSFDWQPASVASSETPIIQRPKQFIASLPNNVRERESWLHRCIRNASQCQWIHV
jgi:hypothetical protein